MHLQRCSLHGEKRESTMGKLLQTLSGQYDRSYYSLARSPCRCSLDTTSSTNESSERRD